MNKNDGGCIGYLGWEKIKGGAITISDDNEETHEEAGAADQKVDTANQGAAKQEAPKQDAKAEAPKQEKPQASENTKSFRTTPALSSPVLYAPLSAAHSSFVIRHSGFGISLPPSLPLLTPRGCASLAS